jgi:hypothetical protein
MHILNRGEKTTETLVIFKGPPKYVNHPVDENSPKLVTLFTDGQYLSAGLFELSVRPGLLPSEARNFAA